MNAITDDLDEDVSELLAAYGDFKSGKLTPSQYIFSISRSEIDAQLRINPQMFLPHLNETLKQIESIDGLDGWSVVPLDQIVTGVRVFKGPRLKSENLIVNEPGPGVEPYYTPSSMLQEKADSAKLLNVARADKKQLATIDAIRVRRGDIVVSRSGTIGRVAIITERYDGAIVSDDLIRVRIDDVDKRNFVLLYLQSRYAQDQMMRNEYGAIQQHLEPQHIRDLLVPWPDDPAELKDLLEKSADSIAKREALDRANKLLNEGTAKLVENLIGTAASKS